jgi:prophage regulatory protein
MSNNGQKSSRVLRRKDVEKRTGLSRSTIYLFMKGGCFPRPINLGPRSVGWLENEIEAWLQSRIQARDGEVAA